MPKNQNPPTLTKLRKYLNADALFTTIRGFFKKVKDHRKNHAKIPLVDILMSTFAMFSLKDPSLLRFDERRLNECEAQNLNNIFGIANIPADSTIREALDSVDPKSFRPAYKAVLRNLQRGKALKQMTFLDEYYLIALDGTGTYSSENLGSASCQTKVSKKTGRTVYYQQMLGAAIICPGKKEVIPLMPEMIIPQDGTNKNDCERNACRRWLIEFRREHPHLKVVITEDALSPNAPHIRDLKDHNCRFILGVKPGDHQFLYEHFSKAKDEGRVSSYKYIDPENPKIKHDFVFINQVPLNKSNQDILVNFLVHQEFGPKGFKEFHWVTDFTLTNDNVYQIMRGGRARWKIENETFNTLKNQGYNLGHNFGLGYKHLSENFAIIMMLAFLVDQALQLACPVFKAALKKARRKKYFWENQRSAIKFKVFDSMEMLYITLLCKNKIQNPAINDSS